MSGTSNKWRISVNVELTVSWAQTDNSFLVRSVCSSLAFEEHSLTVERNLV